MAQAASKTFESFSRHAESFKFLLFFEGFLLFASFGFAVVVIGTLVACLAPRFSRATAMLEVVAGLMVVAGLVMIGSQMRLPV